MRIVAIILLAATAMPAAEVARRDVLLAVEVGDGGFTYDLGTAIGSFTGEDAFDRIGILRLGGRWAVTGAGSRLAPLVGADLELLDAPLSDGGLSGRGLALTAGGTWAAGETLALDLEGFAALHQVAIDLPGPGLSGDGTLQRYGLRTRLGWSFTRHWSLAIEGGWSTWSADLSGDVDRTLTLDGSGLTAGLALAWRPSARPGGVE